MKQPVLKLVILACSVSLLCSCAKINLSGGKTGGSSGNPPQHTGGGNPQPVQSAGTSQAPPPLDGEWEVDYEFKGNPYIGNVTFSQQGTALAGTGADQDGREWSVDAGEIQGTKISFQKKYVNSSSPPITYSGELKYLESPEYTGWAMEGSYTSPGPNGQSLGGKWVANPTAPPAPVADNSAAPPQQAPVSFPFAGTQAPAQPKNNSPEHIGNEKPQDISGHYEVGYQYNFKKIKSNMWLENDGKKVTGHGYDIVDSKAKDKKDKKGGSGGNEQFTIEKGWYEYPRVTLIRTYKGKNARNIVFKAQLSSNGRDIVMKGETQYGGQWDAHLVSLVPSRSVPR